MICFILLRLLLHFYLTLLVNAKNICQYLKTQVDRLLIRLKFMLIYIDYLRANLNYAEFYQVVSILVFGAYRP